MSIISKMYINGDEAIHNILRYRWSFDQDSDRTGKPCGRPTGGIIEIIIEATKDPYIVEWIQEIRGMRHVKIVQSSVLMNGKSRIIEFLDGICIAARDNFNAVNGQPMTTTLVISSPLIVVNGVKIMEKYWNVTDFDRKVEPTVLGNSPDLIEYFITNTEGERIEEYFAGDIIVINLETENSIGTSITLNLNDKEYDFKHNGITLKNDTLENHPINSDLEKVELEVIEPEKEEFEY